MIRKTKTGSCIFDIAVIATCVALLAVSAWITVPLFINFTLQILAVSLISALFKTRIAIFSILSYIFIGVCGIPVFSAFSAGPAALLGPTGGFMIGFIFFPISVPLLPKNSKGTLFASLLIGLLLCYVCGGLWYAFAYANAQLGAIKVISACILPFIIPDVLKIILATILYERLNKHQFFNKIGGHYERQ